jgi:hypothetical protein
MRSPANRKRKFTLSALAAASLAALAGAPSAHAAATFNVSITEAESDVSYGGGDWDVWVVAATRTDTTGVNAGIDLVDVTINSPVPLGIEIQKGAGSGVNAQYSADVDGGQILSNGVNATFNGGPAPAAFGDIVGGTFIGIGQGPYLADYVNNPQITQAGAGGPGTGIDGLVFANNDIGTNTMDIYLNAYLPPHTTGSAGSTLSAAFVSSGTPVSGSLNNGNVKNLNVVAFEPDPGVEADGIFGPVPFANVVVPTGAVFTIHGTIGPSGDDPAVPFSMTDILPDPSGIGILGPSGAAFLALRRTRRKIRSGYANPVTLGNP